MFINLFFDLYTTLPMLTIVESALHLCVNSVAGGHFSARGCLETVIGEPWQSAPAEGLAGEKCRIEVSVSEILIEY